MYVCVSTFFVFVIHIFDSLVLSFLNDDDGDDLSFFFYIGAVDPSVVSLLSDPAQYIGPEWVLFGRPHVQWPLSSVAWSVDAQEYLWNESVRMTGVDFPASRP